MSLRNPLNLVGHTAPLLCVNLTEDAAWSRMRRMELGLELDQYLMKLLARPLSTSKQGRSQRLQSIAFARKYIVSPSAGTALRLISIGKASPNAVNCRSKSII